MVRWILVSAFLAGVDNLQICTALGVLSLTPCQRKLYAITFSAAEVFAALVGVFLGQLILQRFASYIDLAEAWIALLCGVGVLALAVYNREAAKWFGTPGMLIFLPLAFSIDNLLAAFALSTAHLSPLTVALAVGGAGALMSWAGLYVGHWLQRIWSRRFVASQLQYAAGVYLLLLSARMMMK